MRRRRRIHRLFIAIGWLALLLAGILPAGCAKPAGMIFPPLHKPIVWPGPPEPPRIRYVGQIATSADLKPPVPLTRRLGEAIFGKRPTRSMLTPYAVCTDGKHRLFVADSNAQLIHVFDLATRQYTQWKPTAGHQPFSQPVGLSWDSTTNRLYVSDSVGGRIFVFDDSGKTLDEIGGQFLSRPCGLAIDPRRDLLYVADAALHQLVVFTRDGRLVSRFGHRGTGPAEFNFPTNVALDRAGRIYLSDSLNFRVLQFDPDLRPLRQIGRKGDLPGYFGQPKGIATDSENHLYVVDAHFEAVQIFDADGNLLLDFGQEGTGPGEFWLPAGIYIDPSNRIWVADSYNRRVQVFEYLPEARP